MTPWTAAQQASLSFPISQSLLKLMSIESMMPSNHLILCCPLLLLSSVFPSLRVFSSELALRIRWPKCWSFSFSIPVNIQDWFPLGLIGLISLLYKGLLRVFSSTIGWNHQFFWCSTFFVIQPSHLYMTTGKIIALIICIFFGKVISLLFNTLCRLVIDFFPRSKCLIFMAVVNMYSDFGAQENEISHYFHFFPSICYKVMRLDAMIFVFWMLSFKPAILLSSSSRGSLVSLCFLPWGWYHLHIWGAFAISKDQTQVNALLDPSTAWWVNKQVCMRQGLSRKCLYDTHRDFNHVLSVSCETTVIPAWYQGGVI